MGQSTYTIALVKKDIIFHTLHIYDFLQLNSLWSSEVLWCHTFGSPLAQVMACCLMAPSLYLNQCWFVTSTVLWHLLTSKSNFKVSAHATILCNEFESYTYRITVISPRGNDLIYLLWCKNNWQRICAKGMLLQCISKEWSLVAPTFTWISQGNPIYLSPEVTVPSICHHSACRYSRRDLLLINDFEYVLIIKEHYAK